ncbi:hypothetical protein PG991_001562 [Apiospora marii]|uniref:Uncharacterized protein n=1 Tax=Apiospora marii TaxID=335849 RepID=A0ABR1SRT1_9PEZI
MAPRSLAYLVMLLATVATAAPLARLVPDPPTTAALSGGGGDEQVGGMVADRQTKDGVVVSVVAPSGHDDVSSEFESKSKEHVKKRHHGNPVDAIYYPVWIPKSLQSKWWGDAHDESHHRLLSEAHLPFTH